MIRSRRSLAFLAGLAGLSLLSCGRELTGPGDGLGYGRDRIAAFALEPQFPRIPGVDAISDVVPFTRVRITLRRTDGVTARDTIIDFPAGVDSVSLALDVPLPVTAPDSGLSMGLSLAYMNAAGDTVFSGGPLPVTARPSGSSGSTQTVSIPVVWVPPAGVTLPASVDIAPPTGSAVAGTTTTFTATARDGQGQPLTGIPIVFSSVDTTRATVTSAGGVVTWRPVRGLTRIVATTANLRADTAQFTIALPATRLLPVSGDAQSATINTLLGAPIVLRVTASDSVPVAGVPVTFVVTNGGGTLTANADTSDASGLVQTSWTLGALVGAQSVTATLSTNNATLATAAVGTAPLPTQLVFTASPTTATAGTTLPAVTVEVRDAGGARASLFTGPVTIALDAGATGATLAGTATVNAVAGIATFSTLSIQRAATGLTLVATSAGLTPDTSAALTITAAAAANLSLVSGDAQAGTVLTALAAPFVARVTDGFDNPVAGVEVTWAIVAGGGALSALADTTDAAGLVSTTLTLPGVSNAVTVSATATGLTGSPLAFAASALPGAAAQLVFTSQTGGGIAGVPITSGWTVEARDGSGNLVTSFTGPVTLALSGGPGGATLGGTTTRPAVGGIAVFNDLTVDLAFASWRLDASSPGLTGAQSSALGITPAAAANLGPVSGGGQSVAISTVLPAPFVVRVTDAFTNPIAGVTVTWAITAGGGTLSVPTSVTDAAGNASVTYTSGTATGTSTVTGAVAGLTGSPVAFTASVGAGAATALVFTQAPTGSFVAGTPVGDITVQARDAGGNLATGFTGNVIFRINTGPGANGDSVVVAAVGGIATASGESFDQVGSYTLRASAAGLTDAISGSFDITVGAAAFVSPDTAAGDGQSATVGQPLAQPLRAVVHDGFGNPVPGVTVVFTGVRGVDTLSVDPILTDATGVASLTPTMPATPGPVSYIVTSTGLTGSGFPLIVTATAGGATRLVVTQQPGNTTSSAAIPAMTVVAQDALGNLATGFTGNIEVVVDSGPALGWSMGGTQTLAAVSGSASFADITLDRAGQYRLRFRSPGLDSAITAPFVVNPGAAVALSVVEGNGQSAPASAPLPAALGAQLLDAFGNPIAGATVTWSVTAGGGSITPPTSVTDATGIARASWTLGGATGAQGAQADAAGFTAAFTATATATDANIIWTGAVNANWSEPGNWSGGVVPTATDSVRLTTAGATPVLDVPGFARRLRIEAGVDLQLDTFPVFIGAVLDVDPAATVGNNSELGAFVLQGTGGTVRGLAPRLVVSSGAFALDGPLSIASDLLISGGSLAIGPNALTIAGILSTSGAGSFSMTGPGTVTVEGDAIFAGGSTAGQLTAGVLTVRGDFVQAGGSPQAFNASAGHTVVLDGPLSQSVTLLNPDVQLATSCTASCFGTLRSLRAAGTGALQIASDLKALGIIDVSGEQLDAAGRRLISAGTPSLASDVVTAAVVGWQDALVRTGGTFAVDTLIAWGASGTLIVGETVPTIVAGLYSIAGAHPGAIVVDGATAGLTVVTPSSIGTGTGLALSTRGNGRVYMSEAGDTLTVNGDADFGGATAPGTMTGGVLTITGDFTMSNESSDAFIAEGAHLTRLVAANPTARFSRIGGNRFANLDIDATGAMTFDGNANIGGTVKVGSTTSVVGGGLITIGGDLLDSLGTRWQATSTHFQAADPVIPHQFLGSVVFLNGVVLDTLLAVGADLDIRGGLLDLNGHAVGVGGDFEARDTGVLRMVNAADSLIVNGNATFRGGSSIGQLTAGRLELHGAFQQSGNAEAFAAAAAHETWFVSPATATVTFANPGFGAGNSHFGTLYLAQPSGTFALASDVHVEGLLENGSIAIASQVTGTGQRLVSRGADFSNLQFNNVRWQLLDGAPVNAIDSLTFASMDPAAIAFEVIRSGGSIAIPNLTFDGAVPTTGRYLRVEDTDGAAGGVLTIDLTNIAPAAHGGALELVNGALVNGWTIGAFVWSGATSSDWFTAANWLQNAVPTAADSVHIPATGVTSLPALVTNASMRALVNEHASPISLDAGAILSVSQRLAFRNDVAGLVCTSGFVDVGQGSATAVMHGNVDCAVRAVAGTSVTLDGAMSIGAGFGLSTQGTSDLIVNGQVLVVAGAFDSFVSSRLVMTNAADSVDVGDASFTGGATTGTLTAGSLVIRGNLTADVAPNSFDASAAHLTRFVPGIGDTISITANNGPVNFGRLAVARPVRLAGASHVLGDALVDNGSAIVGAGRLRVDGTFTGSTGTLVAPNAVELHGVLADTGTFRPDTTIFAGTGQVMPYRVGPASVPQYQVVRIVGDVTAGITGGLDSVGTDLLVDGGTFRVTDVAMAFIRVGRDFRVTNGGRFFSENQNHQYLIYRHVLFDGADGAGALDSGSFRLRGDFTQLASSSPTSFVPAPAFAVVFDSVGTISFATPTQSRFGRLSLAAFSPTRTLLSDIEVASTIEFNGTGVTLQSDLLGAGGTRRITANGLTQAVSMQLRNVSLRLQGSDFLEFSSPVTFSDFDPTAIQLDIQRDSGTIIIYDPTFSTTATGVGRYLRAIDTNPGDGANLSVVVSGTPTPLTHSGFAEAQAPATITGWNDLPSFTWTGGATNSDWNNTANWSSGAVPTSVDSVFVPGALLYNPSIPGGTVLRSFVSARTEGPISVNGAFTITGSLHVPTVGGLTCVTGSLVFNNPSTPMNVRGRVECFTRILDGTLTVTDSLGIFSNDLQVEGASILDIGSGVVSVDGPFSTLSTARLRMQNAAAHLSLNSAASFGGGSTAGELTAGLLEIGGNFTQNGDPESFSASGTHVTSFRGATNQNVVFANPGLAAGNSHFANLAIGQPAGVTQIDLDSDVFATGQLRSGPGPQRMLAAATARTLVTLGADYTGAIFSNVRWIIGQGAPIAQVDGISFSAMDPTVAQLEVEQSGGTVSLANVSFTTTPTSGSYLIARDIDGPANGFFDLTMVNPQPAGHGGFVGTIDGATISGWDAVGPFLWTGAQDSNWATTSNWLNGVVPGASDSVTISAAAVFGPDINAPTTLRALVNLSSTVAVTLQSQPLTITERLVTLYGTPGIACSDSPFLTIAPTTSATVAGHVACDMAIGGTGVTLLSDSLLLGRQLRIGASGMLDPEGRIIRVLDSLVTEGNGVLRMDDASSVIAVTRDASFRGGSTSGLLSGGRLKVGGDLAQSDNPAAFAPFGTTVELYDAFAGAEGTPTVSIGDPLTSQFGALALGEGARAFLTPVRVQQDLLFGTNGNVTGTGEITVLGALADTMTYSTPPTLTLPRLVVEGDFNYRGTFNVDTIYLGGGTERPVPASINSVRVPYRTLIIGGQRVVTVASAVDSLVTTGDLIVNSTGVLRFAAPGATAVTHIGDSFVVAPGGDFIMTEAGATVIAQDGATLQGTSTANNGVLRIGGDVSIDAGALTAVNLHITELFDGNALIDGFSLSVADTTAYFASLRPESGSWTFAGTAADTVLIQTALNLTGTATINGDAFVKVGGPVQGQPTSTIALRHLAYFNDWQFTGTYAVDTLTLFGTGGQPLYARDANTNPIPYNVVRITGDARPIVDPADELTILNSLLIDGGTFHVGTVANGTDSVRVQINGRLTTLNGGVLEMTHAEGRLNVNGDATFGGGSTDGRLTTGALVIQGDFIQGGGAGDAFRPTGAHLTRFSTEGGQDITFATPGASAGTSSFRRLRIAQASGSQIALLSDVFVTEQLFEQMNSQVRFVGDVARILTVGGANLDSVRFDRVALHIVNGGAVEGMTTLTFDSLPAATSQLVVQRDGGAIALDDIRFVVVPDPGSNYIDATDTNTGDADPLTINITGVSPSGHGGFITTAGGAVINGWGAFGEIAWSGAVNSDWNTAANWTGGQVPDASSNVTIGASANDPVLAGPRTVRNLTVDLAASLTLPPGDTLTVTGNTLVTGTIVASAPNDPTTVLRLAPPGVASLAAPGTIGPKLLISSGFIGLTDSVRVIGDFTMGVEVDGGVLDLNQRRMDITGSFRTSGAGQLQMVDALDSLIVDENVYFGGGSTEGLLTNGTIIVSHDFQQLGGGSTTAFAATGSHTVRFVGAAIDAQVEFASPGAALSRFANVGLDKISGRSVNFFNTPVHIRDIVSNNGPVFVNNAAVTVTGSVVQPAGGVVWDVDASGSVALTGVNATTCDGVLFTVSNTPANFTPIACHDPPATELAWTGAGGNSLWSNPANWSLNRIPVATDSVLINANATVDLSGPATVAWLIMGISSTPTLNLNSGATLQVDSAALTLPGTTVNMVTGATLTGDGAVSLGGVLNWNGGTMSGTGGTVVAVGGTATIASAQTAILDRTLAIAGTATMGAGGMVGVNAPILSVVSGGLLEFPVTASFFSGAGGADSIRIQNNGTIRKSTAAGVVRLDWPIVNVGTIEVLTGTLELRNRLDHLLGSITIANGATLSSLGQFVAGASTTTTVGDGGALTLQAGGVSAAPGAHELQTGSSLTGQGRLNIVGGNTAVDGTIDIDSLVVTNGNIVLDSPADTVRINGGGLTGGGTFDGAGIVAIAGQFLISGNGANGTGTLYIRPSGTLDITGAGIRGWDIDVDGTWVWGANNLSLIAHLTQTTNYPQVNIRTGGLLDIVHGATPFTMTGANSVITNNGTIRKSSGTVNSTLTMLDIRNFTGIVINSSGNLTITNGCTVNGPLSGSGSGAVVGGCIN